MAYRIELKSEGNCKHREDPRHQRLKLVQPFRESNSHARGHARTLCGVSAIFQFTREGSPATQRRARVYSRRQGRYAEYLRINRSTRSSPRVSSCIEVAYEIRT